jgi:hypothetical protein
MPHRDGRDDGVHAAHHDLRWQLAREVKLVGFLLLLVAIFIGAHVAGSVLGPVTTSHSQVSYTGHNGTGGGMNMGAP